MRLIILEPGHFHASLLQREMYPSIDRRAAVYSRLGAELLDYLGRILLFNSRAANPTAWELDLHLSSDPIGEMRRAAPGGIVTLAGWNRGKIDRILAALSAGHHVLADKPWIIDARDMPKLEQALDMAERKGLVAYDIMTERYEVTSEMQREFVNDPEVFGGIVTGSASEPAVVARSVHQLMKTVASVPLRRPAWFFDISELGDGLADVGTHLVDLAQWTLFPDQLVDYRCDIQLLDGRRWAVSMSEAQYRQVTGEAPPRPGNFEYYCNNTVHYTLRNVHAKFEITWNWEAPPGGGDIYEASFRGTKSRIEIRQPDTGRPELYIVPLGGPIAVRERVAALQPRWPGLQAVEENGEYHITVPERYRVGHEAHFAQVAKHFLEYVQSPGSMPAWERAYMMAKYAVTTGAGR